MAQPTAARLEQIRASLTMWLYLTTSKRFNVFDPTTTPATLTPSGWSATKPPANLQALETAQPGSIHKIVNYLATTESPNFPGTTLWAHFQEVQAAFYSTMSANAAGANNAGLDGFYDPDDPNCPGDISYLTQLSVTYPATATFPEPAAAEAE
jgi:hypothetical protein